MVNSVLSVTQINEYLKNLIGADPFLNAVALRGEISNYKLYPSGHHYFTLKDENAAIKCVMFKGNAFRLRFRPENGMKVIALGSISVFPRDGAYQLYCTALNPEGVGDLHIAFEQLKKELSAQGLFDPEHKKPIPLYPKIIGIVTSSAGAALHDMLRILNKRFPLSKVRLFPVRVQGEEAADEIAQAISFANRYALADVLIVGRGGGSIEDLWAFNRKQVAYAIYHSQIPVISAVGHEPDVTISDYVADLRAATPSNAAELAVPDQMSLRQNLDIMYQSLLSGINNKIQYNRKQLSALSAGSVLQRPDGYILSRKAALELLQSRFVSGYRRMLESKKHRYLVNASKLDALSPLKVLTRGYCVTQKEDHSVVTSLNQIHSGDQITVTVSDGKFLATVAEEKGERYE